MNISFYLDNCLMSGQVIAFLDGIAIISEEKTGIIHAVPIAEILFF